MSDHITRCHWPTGDLLYRAYHDEEWGVPEYDSQALFEKLILDGFQAGLAWITILRKREGFRAAFDRFDPAIIAQYGEADIERLVKDERIVRHRGKIIATIGNARSYLRIEAREGVSAFLWRFVGGAPIQNNWSTFQEVPASTRESLAMSKALKYEGFKFCGPTIVYAFMQACGMVNDHITPCFRHQECRELAQGG